MLILYGELGSVFPRHMYLEVNDPSKLIIA